MVSSYLLWAIFALGATALPAPAPAPTFTFSSGAAQPGEKQVISEYFDMLAQKVQAGRKMSQAPVCNLDNAIQPILSPTPLPGPSTGLILKHVAVGRGTQNYTCGSNATAAPIAVGAVATLFNASCIASAYPDLLSILPNVALQFNLPPLSRSPFPQNLNPADLMLSGHHFFTNTSTPFFDLNTKNWSLGRGGFAKSDGLAAPTGASVGQNGKGFGAVPWLKLTARDGTTGGLQEAYRVNTAGGNPPTTCEEHVGSNFDVQYAAEYWFYETV